MKRAIDIAADVRTGRVSARAITEHYLGLLIADGNRLAAVTRILAERARQEAAAVDAVVASGRDPGPLAGVPYGVKDLFDIEGIATTAGSSLYADASPAARDAEAVSRMRAAGAILVATLNMDEFAYGFATINAHHGTTRNPHGLDRLAGGSSGGSAAVVAAGLLPLSLGSDTNGSIRVPAGLTGTYGLKPTHGGLPMRGIFPFAESFDDIGPFTSCLADMACVWNVLSGRSPTFSDDRPLRVARLGGRFAENVDADQVDAIRAIAPMAPTIELAEIARARSAAFLITAAEGGALHREALARVPMSFDPATRDRLIAGALVPQSIYREAQAFRSAYKQALLESIAEFDILIAPSTPCVAPAIADPRILIDGALRPARAELGIHSQPISFMGLPAIAVPLLRPGSLPLGLQLIGRPDSEPMLFRFAAELEDKGYVGFLPPPENVGEFQI